MAEAVQTQDMAADTLILEFGPFEQLDCWRKMPQLCDNFVGAPRSKHTMVN